MIHYAMPQETLSFQQSPVWGLDATRDSASEQALQPSRPSGKVWLQAAELLARTGQRNALR